MSRRRNKSVAVWVLWLLLVSLVHTQIHSAGARPTRKLSQDSTSCPVQNCAEDPRACVFYRKRGWRCKQCASGFASFRQGAECVCPEGQYLAVSGCRPCLRHHYCPLNSVPRPCPGNLVTRRPGAESISKCANPPGYRYVSHPTQPTAVPCGRDTYSTGYKFQAECTACPSGFGTAPANEEGTHTNSSVCIAPPGFLMMSSMVAPCGKGTFSSGYSGNYVPCTKCSAVKGAGITTEGAAAQSVDSCTWVEPGYVAQNDRGLPYLTGAEPGSIIAKAKPCPQNYYCSGGSPFVGGSGVPQPCPNGLRTEQEGATSVDQCVAAPGWYVVSVPNFPLRAAECPDGWYKEGFDRSTTCTRCGMNPFEEPDGSGGVRLASTAGWRSNRTIQIPVLDPQFGVPNARLAVRGSPDSCYLRRGMGSQRFVEESTGSVLFQAIFCPTSDSYYGLNRDLYGIRLMPCFNCLPSMVTSCQGVSNNAIWGPFARTTCETTLAAAAVTSPNTGSVVAYAAASACVLRPGWGWVNATFTGPDGSQLVRPFVQECPVNTYSPGGAYGLSCVPCNSTVPGTTTDKRAGQAFCV